MGIGIVIAIVTHAMQSMNHLCFDMWFWVLLVLVIIFVGGTNRARLGCASGLWKAFEQKW